MDALNAVFSAPFGLNYDEWEIKSPEKILFPKYLPIFNVDKNLLCFCIFGI